MRGRRRRSVLRQPVPPCLEEMRSFSSTRSPARTTAGAGGQRNSLSQAAAKANRGVGLPSNAGSNRVRPSHASQLACRIAAGCRHLGTRKPSCASAAFTGRKLLAQKTVDRRVTSGEPCYRQKIPASRPSKCRCWRRDTLAVCFAMPALSAHGAKSARTLGGTARPPGHARIAGRKHVGARGGRTCRKSTDCSSR